MGEDVARDPECIFCKILEGDIPAYKLFEDEHTFAFMDINPLNDGHALIIPKDHHPNIFDTPTNVLAPLMAARLDLAVEKGCDGVDPDNVNAYENPSGFELAYQHQLDFNLWLAEQAHARGLSIGLKNDLNQIPDLVAYYDWALNEECPYYGECEMLLPFVEAGKAVFGVEYELASDEFCPQTNALNFDFLKKNWDLDAWREACR